MMRLAAVLSLFLALAASAASITSISPLLGTVHGGDTITIVVEPRLNEGICSPPCYLADVTVDGAPARIVSTTYNTIYAVTPAHLRGPAQVAVSSAGAPYGTVTFHYDAWGGAIEASNYERILVPLLLRDDTPIPGAFGSQWVGEFYVRNRADVPVEFFNDVTCSVVCPLLADPEAGYPQIAAKSLTKQSSFGATYPTPISFTCRRRTRRMSSSRCMSPTSPARRTTPAPRSALYGKAVSAGRHSTFSTFPSTSFPARRCASTTPTSARTTSPASPSTRCPTTSSLP